ncbi:MAG: ABC transporter ATP-binding protein [Verrucomicrobiota bacterium]
MVSIRIRALSKFFGDTTALNNINLEIQPGEIFFLLGPSGCGKTTLLRHLAGFYQPDSGALYFDEVDITKDPAYKRDTAMVFQNYALWPHMTVGKNVAFGLEERKMNKKTIERSTIEALEMVHMEEYADRKINQLSGGQQQRVALARAIVVRPKCLLLDEPLSNLDAQLRLEMRSEIRRIAKEFKLTTVYVTHDQKEALSVADRMAILEKGSLAQVGSPEDVFRNPLSQTVASFIGETNFLDGHIRSHGTSTSEVETAYGTFRGRLTDPKWNPEKGSACRLSIRPECFLLQSESAAQNAVSGHLKDRTYLGETAQYEFEPTASSTRLRIAELNPAHLSTASDTVLHAVAKPEDVVILRP